MRLVLLLLAVGLAAGIAAAAPVHTGGGAPASGGVSVAANASQEEALAALHRDTGLLVLSEASQVEHRTRMAWAASPLSELIPQFTETYHLHAMVGSERILFVRRLWDPRELPDIPIAEIRSILSDLSAVVEPLAPRLPRPGSSAVCREFYNGLTPDQLAAARQDGLPYVSLAPFQRRTCGVLCAEVAFSPLAVDLQRYTWLFRHWEQCGARWQTVRRFDADCDALLIRYPATQVVGKFSELEAWWINPDPPELPDVVSRPSQEPGEPAGKSSAACRHRFTPPAAQPVELETLVTDIAAANGVTIRIPEYARDRRFYVFAGKQTGDDVLLALAAAEGWELRPLAKGKYALDRRRVGRSRDMGDACRQIKAAIPPRVRMMLSRSTDAQEARLPRLRRERILLTEQMRQPKVEGPSFAVTRLNAEWQRRFANYLFEVHALANVALPYSGNEFPGWLEHPEQGSFVITRRIDPHGRSQDSIDFRVPKPSEPGRITYDEVGWGVTLGRPGD